MFGSTSSTASGPPYPWASPDFAENAPPERFPGAQSPQGEGFFHKKRPPLPFGNRGRQKPWYHLNSRDAPQADPSPWTLYRAHPSPPTPVQGSGSGMYFESVAVALSPPGRSLVSGSLPTLSFTACIPIATIIPALFYFASFFSGDEVMLNTDSKDFGGFGFADDTVTHFTNYDPLYVNDRKEWLKLYIPARSAVVLKKN